MTTQHQSAATKKNRLQQLVLLVGVGGLLSASALLTKDWSGQVKFVAPMAGIIISGLILVMLLPSMYLDYIRGRKAAGANVMLHRILFCLYWFPFVPFALAGCGYLALYLAGAIK